MVFMILSFECRDVLTVMAAGLPRWPQATCWLRPVMRIAAPKHTLSPPEFHNNAATWAVILRSQCGAAGGRSADLAAREAAAGAVLRGALRRPR